MNDSRLIIEYIGIDALSPYLRNAKKHPEWQVDQICESIKDFGMNDPIAVWGNKYEVVEGHGRLLACKKLGFDKVPVIRLDYLTDDQRKAYALVHNKLTMNTDFDLAMLADELSNLDSVDMTNFGFEESDYVHEDFKPAAIFRDRNILQLEVAQFPGVGKYDIPEIMPVKDIEVTEWISFNYMLSEPNPEGKGVHCFVRDYQFERLWKNPDKYVEKLSRFAAVATPDFSPYGDMPFCLQLFNHYRKHWVGRYLQECGVTVVPTIRCSTDERSHEFYLDGEPVGGAVIISAMWTNTAEEKEIFRREYAEMYKRLSPSQIFLYGDKVEGLEGNIIQIPTFATKRFKHGKGK